LTVMLATTGLTGRGRRQRRRASSAAIVKQIVDAKAQFRSLAEPWADIGTSTSTERLMLAVLGGLADVECDLIRTRTGEGRERAKARGVKLGRKPKLTDHQKREAIRRRDINGETVRDIARSYNVSHSTISRLSPIVHLIQRQDGLIDE
jgi:DNA invertase Pin-like site-specific DNA recombinase